MKQLPEFVFDIAKCNFIVYLRSFEVENYAPTHFTRIVKYLMSKGNGVNIEMQGRILPFNATKLELRNTTGPWPRQLTISGTYNDLQNTPEWDMLERCWDISLISFTNSSIQIYFDPMDFDLCLIAYSETDKHDLMATLNPAYYANRLHNFAGLLNDIEFHFSSINTVEFKNKIESNYLSLID